MLGADLRVGMQRVAVAVERGQSDAIGLEQPEVLLARVRGGEDLVDRQMDRGQEAAGVDLRAVEPQLAQDRQRLLERLVVQAGGVGAELHFMSSQTVVWRSR